MPRVRELHRQQRKRERWLIPWPAQGRHRVVVAYACSYHVGMSNLGFHRVVELLAADPDFRPRRVFLPEGPLRKAYDRGREPLLDLDDDEPVAAARVLALSIAFEEDYLRLPELLERAGIPLWAEERGPEHPLVVAGGFALSLNPEPIAPFLDLVVFGAAERHLPALLDAWRGGLDGPGLDETLRRGWLEELGCLPGIYCPAAWRAQRVDERLVGFVRRSGAGPAAAAASPRGRMDPKVERIQAFPKSPVVPSAWEGPVHSSRSTLLRYDPSGTGPPPHTVCLTPDTEFGDRFLVAVGSGCHYGCRFCTAGFANRPPSAYPLEPVVESILAALELTDKVGLVGPAVTDYPDLEQLGRTIIERGGRFSTSSLKIGPLSHELTSLLKEGHSQGASIAPEAGSQRMRDRINKPIGEEEILGAVQKMALAGMHRIKLYVLCGLPGEEDSDIDAILALGERCRDVYLEACATTGQSSTLTLSVNPFVPKPATPFQWAPMASAKRLSWIRKRLTAGVRGRDPLRLNFLSPRMARIQAYLSLGDRRVAGFIAQAHSEGRSAAVRTHRDGMESVLDQERAREQLLPWDFIDTSVGRSYLWREWVRARDGRLTDPCSVLDCVSCSACVP